MPKYNCIKIHGLHILNSITNPLYTQLIKMFLKRLCSDDNAKKERNKVSINTQIFFHIPMYVEAVNKIYFTYHTV